MKNNLGFIMDMLEHIEYIESFVEGVEECDFYLNKEKEFAVIRSFEVIGEACKKVDDDLKNNYPHIPWKQMAGFRDVLIHDYDRLAAEIVWTTATNLLSPLKKDLQQLLDDES